MSEKIETKEDYAAIYDADYYNGKKSFFYKFSGGYRDYKSYFDRLANWFSPYIAPGKILDAGCAFGFMLQRFQGTHQLLGTDASDFALGEARKRVPEAELHENFLGKDPLPWDENSVDTILSNDVVEHLNQDDIVLALADLYRVLKPGGYMCITTPNGNLIRKIFYRVADRMEHHIGLRHTREWQAMLEQAGFEIAETWTYFHGLFPFRMQWDGFFAEAALVVRKPKVLSN